MTLINSGPGSPALSGRRAAWYRRPTEAADDADKADPGEMAQIKAEQVERQKGKYGSVKFPPYKPGAGAAVDPDAPPTEKPKHWIEIVLKDEDGHPIPGELYRIVFPDGTADERTLDEKGYARYDGIDPGTCKVTFPNLDKKIWHKS